MPEQIRKCPFCGNNALVVPSIYGEYCKSYVCCSVCAAEIARDTIKEAIDAWNKRSYR